MTPDGQLLRDYARANSQEAFGELVRRHVDLVYSAALRQVGGDSHLAQDVAQTVFTDLARKAEALAARSTLSSWLYTSARFAAAKLVRAEHRRRDREERYMRESTHETVPADDWEALRPVLDDAMHDLHEKDREAILLRFFENLPFGEIGSRLGLNENAARMRVERALEKLNLTLARRGIATTAGLAAVLSAHAVQLAPTGLAAALTAASLAGAAAAPSLPLLQFMAMTKLKLGVGALLLAGAATTIILQHQAHGRLHIENESLRQQLAAPIASATQPEPAPPSDGQELAEAQMRELLRLRGEVGLLRRQTNELGQQMAKARSTQPRNAGPATTHSGTLPDEYPRTPDAATKSLFDVWSRGDLAAFVTNFAEPGVPRETYEKIFGDPQMSNYLAGLEVISVGEPTNSFGPNLWFVPYKVRFKDGHEKEFRLHVGQDPRTQRWYFKGGL